jgi:hypothetical protein
MAGCNISASWHGMSFLGSNHQPITHSATCSANLQQENSSVEFPSVDRNYMAPMLRINASHRLDDIAEETSVPTNTV